MLDYKNLFWVGFFLFVVDSGFAQEPRIELVPLVSLPSPYAASTFETESAARNSDFQRLDNRLRVLPYRLRRGQQIEVEWVLVEPSSILHTQDFVSCEATSESNGFTRIQCSLTNSAKLKVAEWTERHINHYVGATINGEVGNMAYIKSRLDVADVEMGGYFSSSVVKQVAKYFRQRKWRVK